MNGQLKEGSILSSVSGNKYIQVRGSIVCDGTYSSPIEIYSNISLC